MARKVVHLTTVHPPYDTRIFEKECRTLAEAGYEVVLVVPAEADAERAGVRVRAVPLPRSRRERATRTAWRVYKAALAERGDVYHYHDPELMPIGLLLRLRGKRVVYDAHEKVAAQVSYKDWIPRVLRKPVSWAVRAVEAVNARVVTRVVAAWPAIAAQFRPRDVVLVRNFPRLEEFTAVEPTPYLDRAPVVAYVGGLTPERGAREMFRAIDLVPADLGARLVIGGTFYPESLDEDAKKAGPRVERLGWLKRPEVARLLGSARMGLVLFQPAPNHLESEPNKLFEYMAAGLPVVASDFPNFRGVVESTRCGILVDPTDPAAIAGAIERLLRDPKEAEAMGARGAAAVRAKYHWGPEGAKLLALYEELLAKAGHGPATPHR